jgi:hypothetical protein
VLIMAPTFNSDKRMALGTNPICKGNLAILPVAQVFPSFPLP